MMFYVYLALLFITILLVLVMFFLFRSPKQTIDLVVARYAEDLDWLNELDDTTIFRKIIIYNKGRRYLNHLPRNAKVIPLNNVGRCDHTYLYHIINNYNNLADVTVFLPGSCAMDFKWHKAVETIELAAQTKNSVFIGTRHDNVALEYADFQLDEWKASEKQNALANDEIQLLKCPERPFGYWYKTNFGDLQVTAIVYHGIFAVSRKHIHQRSIESYETLIGYLDTHSNPEAGHYFERSWLAVFAPVEESCIY